MSSSPPVSLATARSRRALFWQLPLAVLLAALALTVAGPTVSAVPLLYLAAVTPELARVDVIRHRLPNRLVLPGLAVATLALAAEWVLSGDLPGISLLAGGGYFALLLLFALTGGMGMGDVKLAAALGLSSSSAFVALASPFVAFLLGGLAGIVVLCLGRRHSRIAFGPFLLAGFWAALLGETVLGWP